MDLAEYQLLAQETAQPRAYDLEYLIPMIAGETGELLGQRAKGYWHQWTPERMQQELMLEYGDIAWGTGLLLLKFGVHDVVPYVPLRAGASMWGAPPAPMTALMTRAGNLLAFYEEPRLANLIQAEATYLWQLLAYHCEAVTGSHFDLVLQANLAKLASRAKRGVLQGQGDHR